MSYISFTFNSVKLSYAIKAAGLLVLSIVSSCTPKKEEKQQEIPSLPVITIQQSQESIFSEYPASIEGTTHIEVRPQVSGILTHLYQDEGSYVKKGQILFKIDERPYIEQLNQANAQLLAARATLENAELEVEKKQELVKHGVLTDYQLKAVTSQRNLAKANVQQALANVAAAKINVDYTAVRAATNGFIGRNIKKLGSLVGPADTEPLTHLSDVQQLHVYFSLAEKDFIAFKQEYSGESLQQILQHLPPVSLILSDQSVYAQPGRVDMVDGQFDKNTGSITLRATFANPGAILRNGNTGRIRLERKLANVFLIPQTATLEIQDKKYLYVLNQENKVTQVSIKVIGKTGTNYIVEEGIQQGNRIVSKGIDNLKDGEIIQPQPTK